MNEGGVGQLGSAFSGSIVNRQIGGYLGGILYVQYRVRKQEVTGKGVDGREFILRMTTPVVCVVHSA